MSELYKSIGHCLSVFYYWLESMILFFVPLKFKSKDITGELVLITGAGSGIGRLMAVKFAEKGANVVLWDINIKGNEETACMVKEKGAKAFPYYVDVTNSEAVYKTAAKVKEDAGIVTVLVNNAGIVLGKGILELDDKMVRKVFDVNVLAHFWVIKAFLPDMLEKDHGHLVTIASLAGLSGLPRLTDYCASKYAAIGLMESLFVELHAEGRKNIHTTIICPFFINTGMFKGASARFFNNLEPEYVAGEVLAAVQCNKVLVLIPRIFHFLYQLKTLMPARAILALQDATGGSESMESFTGRNVKKVQ